ncbi:MAG: hypothetical protein NT051_03280, partial [Candidatus Micrarchaeota archaeon]|nr:hypothetical protein [Candidatus Micrarchaeota archaeon]
MGALVLAKPTDKDIANIARIEKTIKDNRFPDSRKGAGWHNMSGSGDGRKPMDRRFLKELNKTDNIAVVKQGDQVIGYGVALNSEDRRKSMHQSDVDFKAR